MLGHVVLHDGALQKHAPDLAEFFEHCANLDLTNVVRKPVDAEISFLLECWLSHIHLLELSVGRDKNFLLVFISWERLFVHSCDGMFSLLFADEVDQSLLLGLRQVIS